MKITVKYNNIVIKLPLTVKTEVIEMAATKEPYWSYVKAIIKEYPELKREAEKPREQRVTSFFRNGGRSGRIANPTEECVIHDLPPKKQRKYDAVSAAIEKTRLLHPDSAGQRLLIIDLVYWKQSHTIEGAAMKVPCHRNAAGRWQAEFIRLVADELDLV